MWPVICQTSVMRCVLYQRLISTAPYAIRRISSRRTVNSSTSSFVTTPIFYVNAVPHIGHLYSAVLADAAHRWRCLRGAESAIFSTGTDEHGLKVQQAADAVGIPPQAFCDDVSQKFKHLFDKSNIAYTDYIRTTEDRHKNAVNQFWNTLMDNGYIYEGQYEGWYSTSDEAFVGDKYVKDVRIEGGQMQKISTETGNPVEWTSEKNYMFRLSEFGPRLLEWLHGNPHVVRPSKFHSVVKNHIEEGLQDLSVSRQRERLQWGIPVPDDPSQTIYVWLDALVNYLTVGGYPDRLQVWPATHIVGKDILRFHAVYWPAFLMAAGLQPPKSIVCHSHWTMETVKMSKSLGNVVNPVDRIQRYTSDGLRYYLLREGTLHSDGDYSDDRLVKTVNSDLAGTLGNLVSRVTAKSLNPEQIFPEFNTDLFPRQPSSSSNTVVARATTEDYALIDSVLKLPDVVDEHYTNFEFHKALQAIMSCLQDANAFVQRHEPWNLAKNPSCNHDNDNNNNKLWLHTVLHVTMETLRVCGILLQPVVPEMSGRILDRLGVDQEDRTWEECVDGFRAHRGGAKGNCDRRPLGHNQGVTFSRLKTGDGKR